MFQRRGFGFLGPSRFPAVRLSDTRTQSPQAVEDRSVGLYVCGITPYDTTHLGHAFTYVTFDVLRRVLRDAGHEVRYVQNVTDVDDDIIRRAKELGTTWDSLARTETALYQADMAALNVLEPDVFPRASETIGPIISLVKQLQSKDHAYVQDGNVYFRVSSFAGYGNLSHLTREDMIRLSAERGGDPADPRKEDPLDFVLWQKSAPGEPRWASPWGEGRPGWHVECSAMAIENLGPQVTIHGGGADLVFPHHESEIAQSESATGVHPFVKIWMHVGMVRYRGEKMSKSLRNLVLVRDLLQRVDPDTIRVLLLRHHYRKEWEYTDDDLRDAKTQTEELRRLGEEGGLREGIPDGIREALGDDLNTPLALARLASSLRERGAGSREGARLLGLRLGSGGRAADAAETRADPAGPAAPAR
jgi:L-cysteine:1D-myo-inositol 2-amino-2-deoxy-alpha-D-glucopyranoside ligase